MRAHMGYGRDRLGDAVLALKREASKWRAGGAASCRLSVGGPAGGCSGCPMCASYHRGGSSLLFVNCLAFVEQDSCGVVELACCAMCFLPALRVCSATGCG